MPYALLRLLRMFGHMDFIRYGVRDRVLRAVFSPDEQRNRRFVVPFFGMRYHGNFGNYLDWVIFFYGAYEKGLLFFLRDVSKALGGRETIFIDVGANVGQHTLFMAPHVDRVHAFEPFEPVRRQCQQLVEENELQNVTVHPVGLGEYDEHLPFYAPTGTNTAVGTFVESQDAEDKSLFGKLPVVRGDTYFDTCGINRVDLIKMDIEGFEVFALKGLEKTIAANRPVIVMEYNVMTRDRLESEAGLLALAGKDYYVFSLAGPRHRFVFFAEPARRYEIKPFEIEPRSEETVVLVPSEKLNVVPISARREQGSWMRT